MTSTVTQFTKEIPVYRNTLTSIILAEESDKVRDTNEKSASSQDISGRFGNLVTVLKSQIFWTSRTILSTSMTLETGHSGGMQKNPEELRKKLEILKEKGLISWSGRPMRPSRPRVQVKEGFSLADLIIKDRR